MFYTCASCAGFDPKVRAKLKGAEEVTASAAVGSHPFGACAEDVRG